MPNKKRIRPPGYVYPSQQPGRVHPCKAAGMTRIGFWVIPNRKQKLQQYCKLKGVSMTDLFNKLVAQELDKNYEPLVRQTKRQRIKRRGKAYQYLTDRRSTMTVYVALEPSQVE